MSSNNSSNDSIVSDNTDGDYNPSTSPSNDGPAPKAKRSYKEKNRGAACMQIMRNFRKNAIAYQNLPSKGRMKRQVIVIYTDDVGQIRCLGSKLMRNAYRRSNLKNVIASSTDWMDMEVVNCDDFNASVSGELCSIAVPLEEMSRDDLKKILQKTLLVLNGGVKQTYKGRPKPEYWPAEIDFANPKTRQSFHKTDYKQFPTLSDVLRHVIRHIYDKYNAGHKIPAGSKDNHGRTINVANECILGPADEVIGCRSTTPDDCNNAEHIEVSFDGNSIQNEVGAVSEFGANQRLQDTDGCETLCRPRHFESHHLSPPLHDDPCTGDALPAVRATSTTNMLAQLADDYGSSDESNSMESSNPPRYNLREVKIPQKLIDKFLAESNENTTKNIETCGLLYGKLIEDEFFVDHLLIPKQTGSSDTCVAEGEEEYHTFAVERDLVCVGWIHVHPSQTAFLSSVDLHTQYGYQLMLPEAVAIVCAPKFNNVGAFMLVPAGLACIAQCQEVGFHAHSNVGDVFIECPHVSFLTHGSITVVDFRRNTGNSHQYNQGRDHMDVDNAKLSRLESLNPEAFNAYKYYLRNRGRFQGTVWIPHLHVVGNEAAVYQAIGRDYYTAFFEKDADFEVMAEGMRQENFPAPAMGSVDIQNADEVDYERSPIYGLFDAPEKLQRCLLALAPPPPPEPVAAEPIVTNAEPEAMEADDGSMAPDDNRAELVEFYEVEKMVGNGAKARHLKPHIAREAMKSVTINIGQRIEYNVPVRGEPPPQMAWTFKDQPLATAGNVTIANEDGRTHFVLKRTRKKDAGKYALTASNVNGDDRHEIEVTVLGKKRNVDDRSVVDPSWICPICNIYNKGADMIACDNCNRWHDWECVGLKAAPPKKAKWHCQACVRSTRGDANR